MTVAAGWWAVRPGGLPVSRLLLTLLGAALASAGTGALNMAVEHTRDARMLRTRGRPIAAGRVTPFSALAFGVTALAAGLLVLAGTGTVAAATLAALTAGLYLFVYVPLKPRTDWCVLVGAIPGALPPLIGWAAAGGGFAQEAAMLFGIQYFWQVPHFTSIAWIHRADYARVGWKMLPSPDPDGARAASRVLFHAAWMAGAGLMPAYLEGMPGFYTGWSMALGFIFMLVAVRFWMDRTVETARWVLRGSLIYLPAILALFALARR